MQAERRAKRNALKPARFRDDLADDEPAPAPPPPKRQRAAKPTPAPTVVPEPEPETTPPRRGPGRPPLRVETRPETIKALDQLFYDEGYQIGRDRLFALAKERFPSEKISKRAVDQYLKKQESWAVHSKVYDLSKTQKDVFQGAMVRIQCDLIDMSTQESMGMKWIMNSVDVFSKYQWSYALATKTASDVGAAFEKMLKDMPKMPRSLSLDNGNEFSLIPAICERNNIKLLRTLPHSPTGHGTVERSNRNLRRVISLYRTQNNDTRWPSYLGKLVNVYNTTLNETIGMSPKAALDMHTRGDLDGEYKLYERLFAQAHKGTDKNPIQPIARRKFEKGSKVRLRLGENHRGRLKAGDLQWSRDYYVVTQVQESPLGPGWRAIKYRLADQKGKLLPNLFDNSQVMPYYEPLRRAEQQQLEIIDRLVRPQATQGQAGYVVRWVDGSITQELRANLFDDVPKLIQTFEKNNKIVWQGATFTWVPMK